MKQRCWFVYTFQIRKNGRRDITRRYFLGNMQSEERSINFKKEMVYIFYVHNVVDECTYFTYTELGGRIHRTSRYGCACNIIQFINKKEPAVADSYMKQCDLREIFDDMRRKFNF